MDRLLEEVGTGEVPFQMHYQTSDLRALVATCLVQPDRKARPQATHNIFARSCWRCAWMTGELRAMTRVHKRSRGAERCRGGWEHQNTAAHPPCNAARAQAVLMRDRIRKHLAHDPPLCGEVWRRQACPRRRRCCCCCWLVDLA